MRSPQVILQSSTGDSNILLVDIGARKLFDRHSTCIAGVAEIILRSQTKLSLKCMAAKAVKAYNLSYTGNVPRCLESFIELHGPGLNQG